MTMDYDPLDKNVPVPIDADLPLDFDVIAEGWPGRETARRLRTSVHAADIRRAANPPEISVTLPGLPGQVTTVPGSGEVAWKVPAPGELCTWPCMRSPSAASR
jgi:hypothetical protein